MKRNLLQKDATQDVSLANYSTSRKNKIPKQGFIPGIGNDDNDDDAFTEEEVQTYGTEEDEENIGIVASPYMKRGRFLDTQYGIRKDGELLMMCGSPVFIDTDDYIANKDTTFRGTEGLWEILMRKYVNTERMGKYDLKTHKKY